ncbi:hypothetical protein ACFP1Z_32725 [Streptomyces gamaensis]|uniref:Uncharacterized protein n=1 Tax=Streptomyces gamaensis TaxID=1763542 RepID=A0ABW0Z9W6_9ACTN
MVTPLDALEEQMACLRPAVRAAAEGGDARLAYRLLGVLQAAERAWSDLLAPALGAASAPLPAPAVARVPVPLQVRQSLEILGAPAGVRLVSAVQAAFFGRALDPGRLASLRRDQERAYAARAGRGGLGLFVVPALTGDRLTPARGLLALSVWPLERRIVTGHSPRVDLCVHAAAVAARIEQDGETASAAARDLLAQLAWYLPGIAGTPAAADPAAVRVVARREAALLREQDTKARAEAAARARELPLRDQLFGRPRT